MAYSQDDGPPLFVYAIVAVLLAFFGAQHGRVDLSGFYSYPWRVAEGQLWRLITCTFLHGGILHLAFNALLLVRFARVIDDWMGPWVALAMYAMLAISSNAAQLLVSASPSGVIGASGVVYGLFGFLWVMGRRRDDALYAANFQVVQAMLVWIGICFVINLFGGNIGNTTHVWGLLLGWMTGQVFVARKRWRPWLILATLALWALPIAATQRPVWDRTLSHLPYFDRQYPHDIDPEIREQFEHPPEPSRPSFL